MRDSDLVRRQLGGLLRIDVNELVIQGRVSKQIDARLIDGEPEAADALRHRISEELGWPAAAPEHREEVDLA